MRLHGGLVASDVLFKVKVKIAGTSLVLSETDWTAYPSGSPIIELPPVYLMAQGLHQGASLTISLYAYRPSSSAYALNLDFMQLWPVDGGFRKLKGLAYMSGVGSVVDDAEQNSVWWQNGTEATRQACYYGLGQRIRLMPGKMNIISVVNVAGGSSWLIDDELKITFNAEPVKRDI